MHKPDRFLGAKPGVGVVVAYVDRTAHDLAALSYAVVQIYDGPRTADEIPPAIGWTQSYRGKAPKAWGLGDAEIKINRWLVQPGDVHWLCWCRKRGAGVSRGSWHWLPEGALGHVDVAKDLVADMRAKALAAKDHRREMRRRAKEVGERLRALGVETKVHAGGHYCRLEIKGCEAIDALGAILAGIREEEEQCGT